MCNLQVSVAFIQIWKKKLQLQESVAEKNRLKMKLPLTLNTKLVVMESIRSKIPKDVLDEIYRADQTHVLSFFEEDDYTEEDIASLVRQVRLLIIASH